MIIESGTGGKVRVERVEAPGAESPPQESGDLRAPRNQQKFPRWVRLGLLLGLPAMLWAGIYLAVRELF